MAESLALDADRRKNIPAVLYHYTTFNALVSIYKSGRIWLSDLRYQNDRDEERFTKNLMRSAADTLNIHTWLQKLRYADVPQSEIEAFQFRYQKFLDGRMGLQYESDADGTTPFIFCMSEDGDSLAQWRGYGNQEVCIGFCGQTLFDLFANRGLRGDICKVEYFDISKIDIRLIKSVEEMLDRVVSFLIDPSCGQTLWQASGPDMVVIPTYNLQPFFMKHKGFESEKEWRIVRRAYAFGLRDSEHYFVRATTRAPVPTISEDVGLWGGIKSVTFGPGSDEALVKSFSRLVSSTHAPMPRWDVKRSSIPYRV